MGQLETQVAHTVKITWKHRAVFDKREFVSRLNATVPDSAIITGLTVSDTTETESGATTPALVRTLAITYVADHRDLRRR